MHFQDSCLFTVPPFFGKLSYQVDLRRSPSLIRPHCCSLPVRPAIFHLTRCCLRFFFSFTLFFLLAGAVTYLFPYQKKKKKEVELGAKLELPHQRASASRARFLSPGLTSDATTHKEHLSLCLSHTHTEIQQQSHDLFVQRQLK